MKYILTLPLLVIFLYSFSQDTLSGYVRYDKSSIHTIVNKDDTSEVYRYPGGQLEAVIQYTDLPSKLYTRYYKNGEVMWVKEMKGSYTDGIASFYSSKGKKVAQFQFVNDTISDTIYMAKRDRLLFGNMTYESTVHGGMVREDGTSNISRSSGPRAHVDMYAVKLDSTVATQKIYKEFRTDHKGDFFLVVEKGDFGLFGARFDIKNVQHNMGSAMSYSGKSMHGSWNLNSPVEIRKNCYNFIQLHYTSVGYAP